MNNFYKIKHERSLKKAGLLIMQSSLWVANYGQWIFFLHCLLFCWKLAEWIVNIIKRNGFHVPWHAAGMIKEIQIQSTEFLCFGKNNDFNRCFLFVCLLSKRICGLIQRFCNCLRFSHICLEVKERNLLSLHFFPLNKYTYPVMFNWRKINVFETWNEMNVTFQCG